MTVGIVGAGQLGRMLALAGYPLGLDFVFLDRDASVPAAALAPTLVGEFTDRALLRKLAQRCEVLSFDWENISAAALRAATRGLRTRFAPPLRALAIGQDRLAEKRLFERLGVRTTRYALAVPPCSERVTASACPGSSRLDEWATTARGRW